MYSIAVFTTATAGRMFSVEPRGTSAAPGMRSSWASGRFPRISESSARAAAKPAFSNPGSMLVSAGFSPWQRSSSLSHPITASEVGTFMCATRQAFTTWTARRSFAAKTAAGRGRLFDLLSAFSKKAALRSSDHGIFGGAGMNAYEAKRPSDLKCSAASLPISWLSISTERQFGRSPICSCMFSSASMVGIRFLRISSTAGVYAARMHPSRPPTRSSRTSASVNAVRELTMRRSQFVRVFAYFRTPATRSRPSGPLVGIATSILRCLVFMFKLYRNGVV